MKKLSKVKNQVKAQLSTINCQLSIILALAVCGVAATSCKKDTSVQVTSVQVEPAKLTMMIGTYATLTATVLPTDASNPRIEWSSDNTAVAELPYGPYGSEVRAISTGKATITATSLDGSKTASCIVTVVPYISKHIWVKPEAEYAFPDVSFGYAAPAPLTVTLTNVQKDPTGALTVELTQYYDRLWDANAFKLSATTLGSIANGDSTKFTVTPSTGLALGNYQAYLNIKSNDVTWAMIHLSFYVSDYSISLTPVEPCVFPAKEADYAAQTPYRATITNTGNRATGELAIALSGTNADDFTLSASTAASIDAGGYREFTVAPKTGLAAGNHEATVTVSGENGITATFAVSFEVMPISVKGMTLNKKMLTLQAVGDRETLIASVQPANAANQTVTWSVPANPYLSVDAATGEVTALTEGGAAVVTATTQDGNFTATCVVGVGTLTALNLAGYKGTEITVKYTDGSEKTIPVADGVAPLYNTSASKTIKSITPTGGNEILIGRKENEGLSLKFNTNGISLTLRDAVGDIRPIGSYAEFQLIRNNRALKYVLEADLDLMNIEWTPIGNSGSTAFTGAFDGAGHTVSNLLITGSNNYAGLFGYNGRLLAHYDGAGVIKNLGIASGSVSGGDHVGGLCGYSYYGDITACYNAATVSGDSIVGGLCGLGAGGFIRSCYNTGNVSGRDIVGGVCGINGFQQTLSDCYNIGIVSGSKNVGGVCGSATYSLSSCYWQYNMNGDAVLGVGRDGQYGTVGTDAGTEKFYGSTLPVNNANWVIGDGVTGQWKSLGNWVDNDTPFEYPKLWWE